MRTSVWQGEFLTPFSPPVSSMCLMISFSAPPWTMSIIRRSSSFIKLNTLHHWTIIEQTVWVYKVGRYIPLRNSAPPKEAAYVVLIATHDQRSFCTLPNWTVMREFTCIALICVGGKKSELDFRNVLQETSINLNTWRLWKCSSYAKSRLSRKCCSYAKNRLSRCPHKEVRLSLVGTGLRATVDVWDDSKYTKPSWSSLFFSNVVRWLRISTN